MGIEGKKIMWANLRDLAHLGNRLPDVDFDALIERARHQRGLLEPLRELARAEAFGSWTTGARTVGPPAASHVTVAKGTSGNH
jgi:hypothetical protein